MTEQDIRKEIIKAVVRLTDEKLVARSWGNISARLSELEFIITPSGKPYDSMKEDDLAKVGINDLSFDDSGPKPSSEKGVHAAVYRMRPDACFIIHTHQDFASAVCAAGTDQKLLDGSILPCAEHAAPGSDALCENLKKKLAEYPSSKAFLLANHGTVFFGKDSKEAFDAALQTEKECRELFYKTAGDADLNNIAPDEPSRLDDHAQMMPPASGEDSDAVRAVAFKNHLACLFAKDCPPLDLEYCKKEHEDYINYYSKLWYDNSVMSKLIEINAIIENSPVMQSQLDEYLESIGCPMKANMQIDIAFDEVFTNIASYAYEYKGGPCSLIIDEIEKDGKKGVSLTFVDNGPAYDPLAKEDPDVTLTAEQREAGGLGIFIVKKQMDEVHYEYRDKQNRFTLIKYF